MEEQSDRLEAVLRESDRLEAVLREHEALRNELVDVTTGSFARW